MKLLHCGFDGFDFSIKSNIPPAIADQFAEAQAAARETRQVQLVAINGEQFQIRESGASGGYRYSADTGPMGETWFFKQPNAKDPWGIRVSMKSTPLALSGLNASIATVFNRLRAIGCPTTSLMTSVGRVDYAQDFLLDDFILEPDNFVMHSRMTKAEDGALSVIGRSGKTTAVRIGKIPGKQVAIYDKRADVIAKRKREWWEIWNANLAKAGLSAISQEGSAGRIWRCELRAGKKFLKERLSIRTIDDFAQSGASPFAQIAQSIRYSQPTRDQNRARWPDSVLWREVNANLRYGLREWQSGLSAETVLAIRREELLTTLKAQVIGCTASYASVAGLSGENEDVLAQISMLPCEWIRDQPDQFLAKLTQATDRYCYF